MDVFPISVPQLCNKESSLVHIHLKWTRGCRFFKQICLRGELNWTNHMTNAGKGDTDGRGRCVSSKRREVVAH
jgi:hypothetical protein